MKRVCTIAVVITLQLLWAGAASAKGDWVKVQSKNFTLVSDAGEGKARKLAVELEQFRHVISLLFPKAQIEAPVTTTVFLFKSDDSFDPFKPKYKGKTKENVGGYFLPTPNGNYIALNVESRGGEPAEVIFHEYEHFIMRNNLPRAPLWLNEGLAEFYSTFQAEEDGQKVVLGTPIPRHVFTLREAQGRLPLATLLAVDYKSPHYNESSKAGIFYAKSWALVHYLMLGEKGKRQEQFVQFIGRLNSELSLEENFRQSFQADFGTIEKELDGYIRRFSFPAMIYNFRKELDFSKEVEAARLSKAEALSQLGDLLSQTGRLEEAEEYLSESLGLDDKLAATRISLAYVRLRQRRLPEAYKLLEEAIARDANNYLGHYHYANALSTGGRLDEAVKAYQEAVRLNPTWPRAHAGLGFALSRLGRDDEAVESFKTSARLNPKDFSLFRSMSYAYLRLGRGIPAASNALIYLRGEGWRDEHAPYMFLVAYFGLKQSRQVTAAGKLLEEVPTKLDSSQWPYPVVEYLRGTLNAEQLLGLSTDNDKLTEAHTYIGMNLSLGGQTTQALEHLRWVGENGNRNFVEYSLALAEIRRLETAETTSAR